MCRERSSSCKEGCECIKDAGVRTRTATEPASDLEMMEIVCGDPLPPSHPGSRGAADTGAVPDEVDFDLGTEFLIFIKQQNTLLLCWNGLCMLVN